GLLHPELGHVRVPREGDDYPGNCPVHGDCLEGLVSGPALEQRWGQPAHELPDEHPAWPQAARTLALGLVNWVLTLAPQRVVMGGGVSRRKQLLPRLRAELRDLLGGYMDVPELSGSLDGFLVEPELGDLAGVLGAMSMAEEALTRTSTPRTAPPS
ncbi:MAG: ROK family protein, partial [Myxococcota bacterium]|nr:ROK family protein [Myxococcota bacterium]